MECDSYIGSLASRTGRSVLSRQDELEARFVCVNIFSPVYFEPVPDQYETLLPVYFLQIGLPSQTRSDRHVCLELILLLSSGITLFWTYFGSLSYISSITKIMN